MIAISVESADGSTKEEKDLIDDSIEVNSLTHDDVSINCDRKRGNADEFSSLGTLSQKTIEVIGPFSDESIENVDVKQNESFKSDAKPPIQSWSSRVIGQVQANSTSELVAPPTKWQKASSTRESNQRRKHMRTLYTSTAPLEIISFFYRIGREAREQESSTTVNNLPDDTPIPEPILYELSFTRGLSGSTNFGFGSPSGSQSDIPTHKLNPSDQFQILQRSLSWLGQSISPYTSDQSLMLTSASGKVFHNPSSMSLDEDDIKKLFDGGPEISVSPQSPKIKDNAFSGRHLRLDSVGENHPMDIYSSLSQLGLGRPQVSSLAAWPKKSLLSKPRKRSRRTNSSDFAFSEANEISQVNVSSIRTSKDAKRYLKYEEKEASDNDPFMHLLKSHLTHGSSKKLVSRSMQRSRRWRDEVRKEKLLRAFTKSDPLVVGALLRAATENYEKVMSSKISDSGRIKKISKIDENIHFSSSSIDEKKAERSSSIDEKKAERSSSIDEEKAELHMNRAI